VTAEGINFICREEAWEKIISVQESRAAAAEDQELKNTSILVFSTSVLLDFF
jgi:hypothetical protein